MEYRESPMFGRKVFFLNPPLSIESYVLEWLKNNDYEVYVINDYTYAKPILRQNENALCFIYIDDELPLNGWYNFIKSFENDETLQSVFLGVLSIKVKAPEQEKFLMDLKLPGGFVMLNRSVDKIAENIEGILKINGAKGVRKCIRLDLKDSNEVNGYFARGSMLFSLKLVDISVLGFAAVVPVKQEAIFVKDSVLNNVSITMGRYSITCSVTIFNKKIDGNVCTVVMLLDKDTNIAVKKRIHDFVYDTLEKRHKAKLEGAIRDFTDYLVKPKTDEPEEVIIADVLEEIQEADKISENHLPELGL